MVHHGPQAIQFDLLDTDPGYAGDGVSHDPVDRVLVSDLVRPSPEGVTHRVEADAFPLQLKAAEQLVEFLTQSIHGDNLPDHFVRIQVRVLSHPRSPERRHKKELFCFLCGWFRPFRQNLAHSAWTVSGQSGTIRSTPVLWPWELKYAAFKSSRQRSAGGRSRHSLDRR